MYRRYAAMALRLAVHNYSYGCIKKQVYKQIEPEYIYHYD